MKIILFLLCISVAMAKSSYECEPTDKNVKARINVSRGIFQNTVTLNYENFTRAFPISKSTSSFHDDNEASWSFESENNDGAILQLSDNLITEKESGIAKFRHASKLVTFDCKKL